MFPQGKSTFVCSTLVVCKSADTIIFAFDSEYLNSVTVDINMGRSYISRCQLLKIVTFMINCRDLDYQSSFESPFLHPLTLPTFFRMPVFL